MIEFSKLMYFIKLFKTDNRSSFIPPGNTFLNDISNQILILLDKIKEKIVLNVIDGNVALRFSTSKLIFYLFN